MRITPSPTALDDLVAALVALDHTGARTALDEGVQSGAVTSDRILAAYHELQRRTRDGTLDGATMAAATALCRRLLPVTVTRPSDPALSVVAAQPVVVTSPPAEQHLLDAEAAAAALRRMGWPIDLVCGDVDAADLGEHLTRRSAQAVVVVCASPAGLPEAAAALGAAHAARVPAVVTGAAFGADDLRALRLGADAWAPNLQAVVDIVGRWATAHPEPGPVTATADEYATLRADRLSLIASVAQGRPDLTGGVQDRVLQALLAHLCAAVLVDDSRLLLDFLTGELTAAGSAGRPDDDLVGLLDALACAIPRSLSRTAALVDDGRRHLRLALGRSGRIAPPAKLAAIVPAPSKAGNSPSADANDGQDFADLLLLGAMACQAPLALISIPRTGGRWSTLSFGAEGRNQLDDPVLLDFVGSRHEPLEVSDLAAHPVLSRSSLAAEPLKVRWLYAIPVRNSSDVVVGVFCVLDRWTREVSRREQRAVGAVARQLGGHLERWRRMSSSAGGPGAPGPAPRRDEPTVLADRLATRRNVLPEAQQLLRSHEVAALFDVTERTVINWAAAAKLPALRTIGGHLRFRNEDVMALLADRRTGAARSG